MTDRFTTPFHLRMRSITAQKIKDEAKLKHHVQSQENRVIQQSSHQQIPNMASAYKKVRENFFRLKCSQPPRAGAFFHPPARPVIFFQSLPYPDQTFFKFKIHKQIRRQFNLGAREEILPKIVNNFGHVFFAVFREIVRDFIL